MQNKNGHGRAELRLASLAVPYFTQTQAICLYCRVTFYYNGKDFPEKHDLCGLHEYCLPDLVSSGVVVFVNGPHHDLEKGPRNNVEKDKILYAKLREIGFKIFVIKPEEIDAMTDSTLRIWLAGLRAIDPSDAYCGEKEYKSLVNFYKV